jgi:hypothetical protein
LKRVVTLSVCVLVLMISLLLYSSSTRVSAKPSCVASYSSKSPLLSVSANAVSPYGATIKTRGIVKHLISFYMFEDFWLQSEDFGEIPAVVRFAGLPVPPEGSYIEVSGTMEYCELEGGFCYLNIQSYSYVETASEYPLFAILLLFMTLTIAAVIVYKKKRQKQLYSRFLKSFASSNSQRK